MILLVKPPQLRPSPCAAASPFFPPPGSVYVGADDGAVDEDAADLAQLRVSRQQFEPPGHAAGVEPAAEAVVDGIPGTEVAG
jgi:hypothetical protein